MCKYNSLVRFALANGGVDKQIMIDNHYLRGIYAAGNPTIIFFQDRLYMNLRLVNYMKLLNSDNAQFLDAKNNPTYFLIDEGVKSRNVFCELSLDDYHIKLIKDMKYPIGNNNSYYSGFEDCKFIIWDNNLYAYGTRWDKIDNEGHICIYELNDHLNPINEIIVKSPFGMQCEKNWGAIEDKPFHFVYRTNETIIIKVDMFGDCEVLQRSCVNNKYETSLRGSTPIIRYSPNEYMTLIHRTSQSVLSNGIIENSYQTAFCFYDNDFNITRISKWFVFRKNLNEFTCGLSIYKNTLYISYSQMDCTAHLLTLPLDKLEEFINTDKYYPEFDNDYIYDLAKCYEQHEQYRTSYPLFNYFATLVEDNNDKRKQEAIEKTFTALLTEYKLQNYPETMQQINKHLQSFKDSKII